MHPEGCAQMRQRRPTTPAVTLAQSNHRRPGTVRLVSVTDVHAGGVGPAAWHNELMFEDALEDLASVIDHARRLDADALVLLGDLTDRGDAHSFAEVRRVCEEFPGPVRVVAGNHDRTLDNHTFEEIFASSRRGDVRSAAPDRLDRLGPISLTGVNITSRDAGVTSVGVPLDLDGWPATLTMLLTHYPVLSTSSQLQEVGLRDSGDLANAAACFAELEHRASPTLVLNGHLHTRHEQASRSVLQLSGAALVERPHEVTVIDIETEPAVDVSVGRYTVREEPSEHLSAPILCPSTSRWHWKRSGWERYSDGAPS